MNRRNFLATAVPATFALLPPSRIFAELAANDPYRNNIGLQVYTLRNQLSKEQAVATIKSIADFGYKQIEPYGFPGKSKLVKIAKDHGLAVTSSHFEWNCVVNPDDNNKISFEEILDAASDEGVKHLVVPYLVDRNRKTLDDYKKVAENCNKAAAKAKEAGIQLAYHNHAFEFEPKEDGKCGFDILIAEFSPDMKFELDVFWVKAGNHDPVAMLEKLSGRVSQLHLKDLRKEVSLPNYNGIQKEDFEELGDGMIPMEPIIKAAAKAGVDNCHVEQDHSPDPLASVKKSLDYLHTL
ncbi:MAG: sugar phosphate isomerase/epimerase [Verrucomicrobiales bacterium]|nr:sugar phosphate isomerase/epimerase [Verrucomicrobiales bacterium]